MLEIQNIDPAIEKRLISISETTNQPVDNIVNAALKEFMTYHDTAYKFRHFNKESEQAFNDIEAGKVESFSNLDDFFNNLYAD